MGSEDDDDFVEKRIFEFVSGRDDCTFSQIAGKLNFLNFRKAAKGGMSLRTFVKSRPHLFRVESNVVTLQLSADGDVGTDGRSGGIAAPPVARGFEQKTEICFEKPAERTLRDAELQGRTSAKTSGNAITGSDAAEGLSDDELLSDDFGDAMAAPRTDCCISGADCEMLLLGFEVPVEDLIMSQRGPLCQRCNGNAVEVAAQAAQIT